MLRILSALFVIVLTDAYRQDLAKLPNGNSYGLTLGHPGGNTKVPTKLASTFYQAGQTWNKAFCMADADGDGQSNGLEMGDPCCKWSIGQVPQLTMGLSDPNSAASKTLNKMPPCIMAYVKPAMLQCAVCIQALQLDMAKPSNNAAEFILTSVKSCKDATQDDAQKVLCVETILKNANQLVMDQMNGISPIQSCMNLGLVCMAPTAVPTQPPTAVPTQPPTAVPTQLPTAVPTQPPTTAPTQSPTTPPKPTPPLPPRSNVVLLETSNLQTTDESSIVVPVAISAGGAFLISLALWCYCKRTRAALQPNDTDFRAMPDVEY